MMLDFRNTQGNQELGLFFDQELPHTDRFVRRHTIMKYQLLATPQYPPAGSNSAMKANETMLVEMLFYSFTHRQKFVMNQMLLIKKSDQPNFNPRF